MLTSQHHGSILLNFLMCISTKGMQTTVICSEVLPAPQTTSKKLKRSSVSILGKESVSQSSLNGICYFAGNHTSCVWPIIIDVTCSNSNSLGILYEQILVVQWCNSG